MSNWLTQVSRRLARDKATWWGRNWKAHQDIQNDRSNQFCDEEEWPEIFGKLDEKGFLKLDIFPPGPGYYPDVDPAQQFQFRQQLEGVPFDFSKGRSTPRQLDLGPKGEMSPEFGDLSASEVAALFPGETVEMGDGDPTIVVSPRRRARAPQQGESEGVDKDGDIEMGGMQDSFEDNTQADADPMDISPQPKKRRRHLSDLTKSCDALNNMAATISTELIESIFEYAAEIDATTAANVCLTNKLGRKIATPVLYRTIRIAAFDTNRTNDDPVIVWSLRSRRLQQLCRTLMDSPGLAKHVRYIDHAVDFGVDDFHADVYDSAFIRHVWEKTLALNPPVKPAFQATMKLYQHRFESLDMLVFFLLLICSGLESLHLEGLPRPSGSRERYSLRGGILDDLILHIEDVGRHRSRFDRFPQYHVDGMQNVRDLGLNCGGRGELRLVEAGHLLRHIDLLFPNLRAVTIGSLEDPEDLWSEGWSVELPALQKLTIKSCGVTPDSIANFVSAFTGLRSLSISFNKCTDVYGEFDWSLFISGFACCTNLETLELDYLYLGLQESEELQPCLKDHTGCNPITDLSSFQHLRRLSVPAFSLFGCRVTHDRQHVHQFQGYDRAAQILPRTLTALEVLCEREHFTNDDLKILRIAEWLEDVTIFNCFREKWISRRHGEGSVGEKAIQENKDAHLRPLFNPRITRKDYSKTKPQPLTSTMKLLTSLLIALCTLTTLILATPDPDRLNDALQSAAKSAAKSAAASPKPASSRKQGAQPSPAKPAKPGTPNFGGLGIIGSLGSPSNYAEKCRKKNAKMAVVINTFCSKHDPITVPSKYTSKGWCGYGETGPQTTVQIDRTGSGTKVWCAKVGSKKKECQPTTLEKKKCTGMVDYSKVDETNPFKSWTRV
ncbi:hypothetical protein PRZ48_012266 [Zasmidium cellare]|uniref:Uncharacterized protein n=1 Tax=Zasmidium cellare TaxID=395010 RepID=A0ABR0E4Y9_ZASCE|nr:hypothetical protein PRZ48_012266 [Zasmidium cellare]